VRNLNNMGVYKALLLAGCAGTFVIASPAIAQQAQEPVVGADTDLGEDTTGTIFVTGSRIARPDFTSNSPTVTVGEELLDFTSTAAIETNLNRLPQFVPAQTPTAGGDIQPTATNTPGAATISLRGIGANRNLVLVDGRRSTPSNASGVTDISTIPAAAIERIEIISGGASATYGADAVAGVTNFILKKNFQGLELDGRATLSQEGDGFEYQLSGIMGTDFPDGRGNISLALAINTREAIFQKDRDWYQDLWNDPLATSGAQFFVSRPGFILSGANPVCVNRTAPGCTALPAGASTIGEVFNQQPGGTIPALTGSGYNIFFNPNGTAWTGTGFAQRGGAYRFASGPLDGNPWRQTALGTIAENNTSLYLILPLTRYNAFARGNYEISDSIGMFGQALFSHVNTYTRNEPGPITTGWDVFLPYGTGVYVGSLAPQPNGVTLGTGNPSSVILNGMMFNGAPYVDNTPNNLSDNPNNPAFATLYGAMLGCGQVGGFGGCTNNQAIGQFLPPEMQALLNARNRAARPGEPGYIIPTPENPNPVQPRVSGANEPFSLFNLLPDDRETFTDVMTYNIAAGFEGAIPGSDWTWEAFVNHGESHTFARQTGVYSLERTQTVLGAPGFGRGFRAQGNQESGGFGASTGQCTTGVNFFNPPTGGFSEDCLEAMRADLKNRSKFRQTIVEANLQGGLFQLPAGQVRAAVGASYREMDYEFLNDTLTTQGRSFLDQALGIYPSGNAFGFIDVKELYGELLIPVLSDVPFIQEFNLEVGGRMSNYSTTGTSYTYKILGDWRVNDWLRFRGGYNRAERAPNIGELFLTAQQTFGINAAGDVCSTLNPNVWSANTTANPTSGRAVQGVCRALMQQAGPEAIGQYYGPGSAPQSPAGLTFAFLTAQGNTSLVPETADTWTAGVVIQSPMTGGPLSRLRMSVDWYDITVKDAIGLQTAAAVQRQCFDPLFNPAVSGADFTGDPTGTGGPNAQAVTASQNPFCQLVPRTAAGALGNIFLTYSNSGRVHLQGIDVQVDWGMDIGPGTLSLNSVFNYQINFESSSLFPQIAMVDYVGTGGTGENGLNTNVFEYRALTTLGYSMGPWRTSLQWQHYPSLEDAAEATVPGGTPNTAPYPSYNIFHLNASYQVTNDIGIRFGVDNLLNQRPPLGFFNPNFNTDVGQLRQGNFLGAVHDTNGRRFWVGGNVRF
jgi:iron complex outermembrane recepter protein